MMHFVLHIVLTASLTITGRAFPALQDQEATAIFTTGHGWVHLVIPDGPGQDVLRGWLEQRGQEVIDSMPIPAVAADQKPPWWIRIEASGHVYEFRYSVEVVDEQTRNREPAGSVECKCSAEEFLDSVEQSMRSAIEKQLQHSNETALKKTSSETSGVPVRPVFVPDLSPDAQAPIVPPARGGFGRPGIVGAVVGTLGIVPFAIGLERALRDDERTMEDQGYVVQRYHSPATHAALGIGAAMMATGITLIAIDVFVCRKRPKGCRRLSSPVAQTPITLRF